jgi:S-layer family protein
MSKRSILTATLLSFSFFTFPLQATTIVPPDNLGQLAHMSRAVVFGQAVESWVEEGGTIPATVTRFHLLEQVAGASPGFVFEVREPGGTLRGKGAAVEGAPRYREGRNYLLFLDRAPGGRWRSKMMAYGLLEEDESSGLLRPLPEAARIEAVASKSFEPVVVYRKETVLAHLREVARGAPWSYQQATAGVSRGDFLQATAEPLATSPSGCQFLTDGGDNLPIRWFGYEDGSQTTTIVPTTPGQTGISDGGVSAVQQGVTAWTDHPDSVIRFFSGPTRPRSITCSGSFDYDQNAVVFNDPCDDIADLSGTCSGTLAFGGALYDNTVTRSHDGELWHPALNTFVVVNNGTQCVGEVNFKEVLTHELGHTQGFSHHNPPNPADATMSAFLKRDGRGASIASVDKICASYTYHTFLDVPYSHMFWRHIEAIENARITGGCGGASYCPGNSISRAEVSIFLVRGSHGSGFIPPSPRGMFTDVPTSFWAAAFIEQLAADGISRGCGADVFCPNATVTRAQMAVFLVRARHGSSFVPPPATGTTFADVPASYWAASYIEQLYADGITGGCAATPERRYCPDDNVSRGEMAVFLARTYNLPLP